ncbi:hypothetical protein D9615_009467 [Tricholomella constricta]|uniref:Uncharacterized protein n=1 Tax=Tricholomella constricta TaxID=117010 RepID=A0A8H5GYB8_9AGAR|nr:hypothetical protein D9615_009467 [Tricholomella constricta]
MSQQGMSSPPSQVPDTTEAAGQRAALVAALELAREAVRLDTQSESRVALDKYIESAGLLRDVLGRMRKESASKAASEYGSANEIQHEKEWEQARVQSIIDTYAVRIGVFTSVSIFQSWYELVLPQSPDIAFNRVITNNQNTPELDDIDPLFLRQCRALALDWKEKQADPDWSTSSNPTPVSPTATRSRKPSFDPARRPQIVSDYPSAFSDTYGTVSGSPFIYKTGDPWPQHGGPDAEPYLRQLCPVNDHPIIDDWISILRSVETYLGTCGIEFTAICGFAWGNQDDKVPFCPLVMTIGVEPASVTFVDAKAAADVVKATILVGRGFPEVEVAIWEWTTSFAGRVGPSLPSLNTLLDEPVIEVNAPFSSALPLAIAPLNGLDLHYEGTGGMFLRRTNGSEYPLLLTVAHVARPPTMFPDNAGLTEQASAEHREAISLLGEKGFLDVFQKIKSRRWKLLREEEETPPRSAERSSARSKTRPMRCKIFVEVTKLQVHVILTMIDPADRVVGRVLHADPVGPSPGPEPFTVDWAVIQITHDAFEWDEFQGNKVYIGDRLDVISFPSLMYPWDPDRAGYSYPEDGLLEISDDTVPESELRQPTQHNELGAPALPVLKNGSTTGTTVGWLNGLKALVRHHEPSNHDHEIKFTSFETTIVPYGGDHGAFSGFGDSGSVILDRKGRKVALLTGGGGLGDKTDVTFATAWHQLEPLIKETLDGVEFF